MTFVHDTPSPKSARTLPVPDTRGRAIVIRQHRRARACAHQYHPLTRSHLLPLASALLRLGSHRRCRCDGGAGGSGVCDISAHARLDDVRGRSLSFNRLDGQLTALRAALGGVAGVTCEARGAIAGGVWS